MAKNKGCGCSGRRDSNNSYGCLNCVDRRCRWDNYPYYGGPCPDANGDYDCGVEQVRGANRDCDDRCRRGHRCRFGVFSAMLPMAVAANGIIPLVNNSCGFGGNDFPVNSGLITVEREGTYLATYTVRVPDGAAMASTLTLNVNDASQSSAIAEIGGVGPAGYTAQAIFDVGDHATVALRTSEAINLANPSAQPLVTLSLVRLDDN